MTKQRNADWVIALGVIGFVITGVLVAIMGLFSDTFPVTLGCAIVLSVSVTLIFDRMEKHLKALVDDE